jgi:hypothetical protein
MYFITIKGLSWYFSNETHVSLTSVTENGPKQTELLLKKQNVVKGIMNIFGSKLLMRNSKESPIIKKKEPRPHIHQETIHRHEEL